jgi:hypothetical protein
VLQHTTIGTYEVEACNLGVAGDAIYVMIGTLHGDLGATAGGFADLHSATMRSIFPHADLFQFKMVLDSQLGEILEHG